MDVMNSVPISDISTLFSRLSNRSTGYFSPSKKRFVNVAMKLIWFSIILCKNLISRIWNNLDLLWKPTAKERKIAISSSCTGDDGEPKTVGIFVYEVAREHNIPYCFLNTDSEHIVFLGQIFPVDTSELFKASVEEYMLSYGRECKIHKGDAYVEEAQA